jgi:hypothetical protein
MRTIALLGLLAVLIGFILQALEPHPKVPTQNDNRPDSGTTYNYGHAIVSSLKSVLKDPDSLRIYNFIIRKDFSKSCMDYGARNGFGGMDRQQIVFIGHTPSDDARVWNKTCLNMPKTLWFDVSGYSFD